MDKRYQVFVSSTYVDLVEERREVIQALLELDCLPAAMEIFPAADDDQWTLIQRVIDESDYYIVVVGGRYGSLSAEGISYTEREYDYAVSIGKPVLGFVHGKPDDIPQGKTDQRDDAREKLDAFRNKVRTKMVKEFTNPAELGSVVSRSLIRLMKDKPAEGWVRGRHAMTPETAAEVASLREKLATSALERLEAKTEHGAEPDTTGLAQDDEPVEIEFHLGTTSYSGDRSYGWGTWIYTWNELFRLLAPEMLDEASESTLVKRLKRDLLLEIYAKTPHDELPNNPTLKLDDKAWPQVKVQFRALGLIDRGTKKRPVADREVYWRLTPRGDALLVRLLALKTGETKAPDLPQPDVLATESEEESSGDDDNTGSGATI